MHKYNCVFSLNIIQVRQDLVFVYYQTYIADSNLMLNNIIHMTLITPLHEQIIHMTKIKLMGDLKKSSTNTTPLSVRLTSTTPVEFRVLTFVWYQSLFIIQLCVSP